MTFELSLKIKLNSLINKQIQEVFLWSRILVILFTQSHHNFGLGVYSATLSIADLKSQSCLMDSLWYFWFHLLINSTHIFYNWMKPLPIFSFFYLSNSWLSIPPFQKTWKSLILNPTFISIHLHHNLLLLLRLCPQDDSFKEFYALHMFDFPCPMCCTIRDLEPPAFVNGVVRWVVSRSTKYCRQNFHFITIKLQLGCSCVLLFLFRYIGIP